MCRLRFLIVLSLLILASQSVHADVKVRPVNGVYSGWEPLPKIKGPFGKKWFRQHKLTVRGETVELLGRPVAIKGREFSFSASEGGFLTYQGGMYEKGGKLRVKLIQMTKTADGDEIEDYGGKLAKDDMEVVVIDLVHFTMGGIVYTLQDHETE